MICSKLDPVVNYSMVTTPLWKNVCKSNSNPEKCRLSSFSAVTEPAGNSASDNHHLAKVVTYDLHMLDGSTYPDVVTENGLGKEVKLEGSEGLISWMNSVSSDFDGTPGEESGNISVNFFTHILAFFRNLGLKVVNIFQRLLGL